jgi:hypothetical protein
MTIAFTYHEATRIKQTMNRKARREGKSHVGQTEAGKRRNRDKQRRDIEIQEPRNRLQKD